LLEALPASTESEEEQPQLEDAASALEG